MVSSKISSSRLVHHIKPEISSVHMKEKDHYLQSVVSCSIRNFLLVSIKAKKWILKHISFNPLKKNPEKNFCLLLTEFCLLFVIYFSIKFSFKISFLNIQRLYNTWFPKELSICSHPKIEIFRIIIIFDMFRP